MQTISLSEAVTAADVIPQALREELFRMWKADPSTKAIVVSRFSSMLDITNFLLEPPRQLCTQVTNSMLLSIQMYMEADLAVAKLQ